MMPADDWSPLVGGTGDSGTAHRRRRYGISQVGTRQGSSGPLLRNTESEIASIPMSCRNPPRYRACKSTSVRPMCAPKTRRVVRHAVGNGHRCYPSRASIMVASVMMIEAAESRSSVYCLRRSNEEREQAAPRYRRASSESHPPPPRVLRGVLFVRPFP